MEVYCVFQYWKDDGVSQEMMLEVFKDEKKAKEYVKQCREEEHTARYDYLPFRVIE